MTSRIDTRSAVGRLLVLATLALASALGACADEPTASLTPSKPSATMTQIGSTSLLSVTPATYDYGTVLVGQQGSTHQFQLTNIGVTPMYLTSLSFGGANPTDFFEVGSNGATCSFGGSWTLDPGVSCYVAVLFAPSDTGARSATLDVVGSNGNASSLLTGTGQGPTPKPTFSPDPVSFGQQVVGISSPLKTVRISNDGTANLVIGSFSISGANYTDFSVSTASSAPCLWMPLAPGQYCEVLVEFGPSAVGARNAKLNLSSASGYYEVNLDGTGIAGGDVAVSMSAATSGKTITYTIGLKNVGSTDATRVSLYDFLPTGTTFVSLTAPSDMYCSTPPVGTTAAISCSLPALTPGASRTVQLVAKVSGGVKGSIVNTATVSTVSLDPVGSNDVASVSTQLGRK